MKNTGFTLVELIITIALIAIISVSIGVSIVGMLDREKDKQEEEFFATIENAACVYAEINNIDTDTDVSVNNLIAAGLLNSEISNPKNNLSVIDYKNDFVSIKWDNGKKICEFNLGEN